MSPLCPEPSLRKSRNSYTPRVIRTRHKLVIILSFALLAVHGYAAGLDERTALAKIDRLCRCTGLERKSGISPGRDSQQNLRRGMVSVSASADGKVESTTSFFTDGYIVAFCPADYVLGAHLPVVKSVNRRQFCLQFLRRLRNCELRWDHYGQPIVEKDPRGYRVRYESRPQEKSRNLFFSLTPTVAFAMTPKGTIFAIWIGE